MKTERIYLRTTPKNKKYLQKVAKNYFKGNLSAVFEYMIEHLDIHMD
ncbi:hypothetical protein MKY87_01100 [Paenibacillus sp. FSL R7-0198]|uniref:Uncharacterized protein n=1 Tax=Paenibacillus amylolyticus TaxID=1451 RepID=A0A100VLC3_PAEAM|nr:hypothetical protein [Paenibacillus amylolyticus]GAS81998.1 unknown protein [Paenibacillus amylolyticus]